MASKIQESLEFCPTCNRKTVHLRQTKQMSWVIHLVLTIFTGFLWLIVLAFIAVWHALTKPIGGKKTCSQCGLEH